ncbi:MAG TPA: hypothetical protein DCP02_04045 [Actinobacteria bacterium]|nr:hypothetical protein [Actinomycetota bacterium]
MIKEIADEIKDSISVSYEQVVREEYEMIILKKLYESGQGKSFVFKGGTALRLAYGSPRFSEDLDFTVVKDFSRKDLTILFKALEKNFDTLKLIETKQKYYTYFGLYRVKEDFMKQAFSIKFEASIRSTDYKEGKDYCLKSLSSPVTNLSVLALVDNIDNIKKDKEGIKPPRPRDVFDLWYINQEQGKSTDLDLKQFNRVELNGGLLKNLPIGLRDILKIKSRNDTREIER